MPDERQSDDMNKALFANLVMMLSSSAMQQLGKLVNPLTGKTEVRLDVAQVTIDMLAMLQEKTKGNLDKEESRMLNDLVSTLQMNYVDTERSEAAKPKDDSTKPETPPSDSSATTDQKPDTPPDGAALKDAKDPKFHKTYGTE